MYHHNSAFSRDPVQECLIYFKSSLKTFSVWFVEENETHKIEGKHWGGTSREQSISFKAGDRSVTLDLKVDERAPWTDSSINTPPLIGDIIIDGAKVGTCKTQNSYLDDEPVIRVAMVTSTSRLAAFRMYRRADSIASPLLVFGVDNSEMILEHYWMLDCERRSMLPESDYKRSFVGSCRTINFASSPVLATMVELVIVVTMSRLIVSEYYMDISAT